MSTELLKAVKNHLSHEVGLEADRIEIFIKEASSHLSGVMDDLDEAIDEGDFETVVVSAHKLKGCLCNLGLDELSKVAQRIETTAASNIPANLNFYFLRLRRELMSLI